MARPRIWHLPGSPIPSMVAGWAGDFEVRPLPDAGPGTGAEAPGALVVDLDGGDLAPAAAEAARRFGLPVIALLGPGAAEPPLACHALLAKPVAPFVLATALASACEHVRLLREREATRRQLEELNAIGVRLTAERDTDVLLELILTKARAITSSDAGSIYLVEEPPGAPRRLRFKLAQNDSVTVPFTEFTLPISDESIAGYVALTGELVQVDDAYQVPQEHRFRINREFDGRTGYRTRSMLVVAMRTPAGEVTGVLQLINCKREAALRLDSAAAVERDAIPYPASFRDLAASLASQAAVALDNSRLYGSIHRLFEGFVQAAVTAIESRDPATSGHSDRVARLTVALAAAADRAETGPLRHVRFSPDEMREIRYASLLHDFGKVAVREEILVKAKKLHPWQLEMIRHRAEIIKRGIELRHARRAVDALLARGAAAYREQAPAWDAELACLLDEIEVQLKAVAAANEPLILPEAGAGGLSQLARRSFADPLGEVPPLVTGEELAILSIPRGSLTAEEFSQIQSHVEHTYNFLREIPWTRELSRIPEIARGHHEKLDGSGYPLRRRAGDIPIQTRMITVADIFDALTAADRPYKAAVPVPSALDILRQEAQAGTIDPVLLDLFVAIRPWEGA